MNKQGENYKEPHRFKIKSPAKQKVQLGEVPYMSVDISTKEGRDILKRHRDIPTVSSSDPSRVTKPKFSLKNTAKKIIKTGGRVLGGLGVAATLHEFYKSGQKHSGGKAPGGVVNPAFSKSQGGDFKTKKTSFNTPSSLAKPKKKTKFNTPSSLGDKTKSIFKK